MELKEYYKLLKEAEIMWVNCPKEGQNVLLPRGVEIRDNYYRLMYENIKKLSYLLYEFPILLDESFLKKQKKFEDFNKGVIWISKFGNKEIKDKIYLRPSGEGVIYPSIKKQLRSKNQLPIKIFTKDLFFRNSLRKKRNPFISGSGKPMFEGHGFFSNEGNCFKEIKQIMKSIEKSFNQIHIYPIWVEFPLEGNKKISEKTYGLMTFLPNGKSIMLATFYYLGEKYSKELDISYDNLGKKAYAEQISFGFTDRPIGLLIKYFADDKGLILPKLLCSKEVSFVIFNKGNIKVLKKLKSLEQEFIRNNVQYEINISEGREKIFEKIQSKGSHIILSLGEKEIIDNKIKLENRILNKKYNIKFNNLISVIKKEEKKINVYLNKKSKSYYSYKITKNQKQLEENLKNGVISKISLCNSKICSNNLKKMQKGEILGFEVNNNLEKVKQDKCIFCGNNGELAYYGLRV